VKECLLLGKMNIINVKKKIGMDRFNLMKIRLKGAFKIENKTELKNFRNYILFHVFLYMHH